MNNEFCVFSDLELEVISNLGKLQYKYDESDLGPLFALDGNEANPFLKLDKFDMDMATFTNHLRDCFEGWDVQRVFVAVLGVSPEVKALLYSGLQKFTSEKEEMNIELANALVQTGQRVDDLVFMCRGTGNVLYFKTIRTTDFGVRTRCYRCVILHLD